MLIANHMLRTAYISKTYKDIMQYGNADFTIYPTKTYIDKNNYPTLDTDNVVLERIQQTQELCCDNTAYNEFYIPKRKGGKRLIQAPNMLLANEQKKTVQNLKYQFNILTHNAAHAYVKNRSTYTALKQHQRNQSKFFLKLDIKNFFPSCTKLKTYTLLKQIYPFALMDSTTLDALFNICFLNDYLPQGTPASPMLTNWLFTPLDYSINNFLYPKGLIYTRYADDLLISAKENFNFKEVEHQINILLNPYFELKESKTRYGSITGANWNLGLMLNKDNNITLGHVKTKKIKAMFHNWVASLAYPDATPFNIDSFNSLMGELGQLKYIDRHYHEYMTNKILSKYNLTWQEAITAQLNYF